MIACKRCEELMSMDRPCGGCGWVYGTPVATTDPEPIRDPNPASEPKPKSLTIQEAVNQNAIEMLGGTYAAIDHCIGLIKEKYRRLIASNIPGRKDFDQGFVLNITISELPKIEPTKE